MNDRGLLERAAKAAGYTPIRWTAGGEWPEGLLLEGVQQPWNPLASDGDAMRLAVKLSMRVYVYVGHGEDYTIAAVGKNGKILAWSAFASEQHGADAAAATRRAIVRCAASYLGEQA